MATTSVIDAHLHVTEDGSWYGTGLDASVDRALREMDRGKVEKGAVIATADEKSRNFTLELASKRSDRFFTGFTVQSLDERELGTARTLLESKTCRFLKVHPRSTGIAPLDPGLSPFLELAAAQDVPVTFCTYVRGGKVPMRDLSPLVFDDLARRHPNLKIILAHAGSYRALDALAVAQSHANVYLEMSHVLEYFRDSSIERDLLFSMDRLDRKIIFGSDFPEYPIDSYLDRASTMTKDFKDFDREGFFRNRAEHLFKV